MEKPIFNLYEPQAIAAITNQLSDLKADDSLAQTIIDAANVLRDYRESFELSPREVSQLFNNIGIRDDFSPEDMQNNLKNTERAYVLRRRYFNSWLSRRKFESTLFEVVSELANAVSPDVLTAIVALIKNFSLVCLEAEGETVYKEMLFKFFCKDADLNKIILLVINLDYSQQNKEIGILDRLMNCSATGLHLSFFGAIVKTEI